MHDKGKISKMLGTSRMCYEQRNVQPGDSIESMLPLQCRQDCFSLARKVKFETHLFLVCPWSRIMFKFLSEFASRMAVIWLRELFLVC